MICKFVTSLLLFYYYKLEFLCLRDEQAVYKQGSVHVSKRRNQKTELEELLRLAEFLFKILCTKSHYTV